MHYYWVIDYLASKDGKTLHPVVIGGRCFTSEMRAQQFMDQTNLSPKAEIMELDTSNTSRASQEIKAKLAVRLHSLEQGMAKAVHKLPEHKVAVGDSYAR
jgi:hypothetical protein